MRLALIVEQALAPVPGGTGRYAVELAAALAGLDGVDVTGWTAWHRGTAAATVPGVRGPRRLPLPRARADRRVGAGLGPVPSDADLVHATTLLLPPRRARPLVVTIHDAVPWTHPETLTPRGVRWHRAMAERAARTADAIVVPSAATARALAGVPGPGARAGGGPARRHRAPAPADAPARLERLGLAAGGYVLSLATLEPRKGLDVLIRAMATPAAPALPLVLVGAAGWGGVDPPAVAAEAGLAEGRLRVLGRLGDDDLAAVLGAATVLTVPSRVEGFGLPVVEGMAAGVPVVTSRDDALVEVGGPATLPSDTGDPDALADALARVCTDTALRASMIAAGRDRAAGYTWRATAERQAEIYRRLL